MALSNSDLGKVCIIVIISVMAAFSGFATCRAHESEIIIVSEETALWKTTDRNMSLFSKVPLRLGSSLEPSIRVIDVDVEELLIFWIDATMQTINRVGIDGKDFAEVTSTGSDPKGIAVDPITKEIYWTDAATDSIEMVKYDGSGRRMVLSLPRKDPEAIALDPVRRVLYWTTTARECADFRYRCSRYEDSRQVGKVNCDGTGLQILNTRFYANHKPTGIALNANGTLVYWCSYNTLANNHYIYSVEASGGENNRITESYSNCKGLAWFDGMIYWADETNNNIQVVNEETQHRRRLHNDGFSNPQDVYVGRLMPPDLDRWKCDFQNSRCNWRESENDDFDWTPKSGDMVNSTGPLTDHTTRDGGGRYMFIDHYDSSLSRGQEAVLVSPPLRVTDITPKCFRFWYHMHEVVEGSLKVFFQPLSDDGNTDRNAWTLLWSAYGEHSNEWFGAEVEVKGSGVGNILVMAIVGDPESCGIALDNVEYGDCRQDSTLSCGHTSMTMYLDRALLGISTNDDVTLKSSHCRGVEYDHDTIAITTSYVDCDTTLFESDNQIMFSNVVTVETRSGVRSTNILIPFNCSMGRNYRVDMAYLSHSWIRYVREAGYGNFSVTIWQYPDGTFQEAYPTSSYPQQVDDGDRIYMATALSLIADKVETKNTRCWATQSPDPSDSLSRELIADGCPVESSVRVISSSVPNLRAFSFRAFTFQEAVGLIYIHCDVIVCHKTGVSVCAKDCSGSRRRRELRTARGVRSGPHTVTQGPFVSKIKEPLNLNGILLIVACVCVLLLTTAIVYRKKNA